MAQTIEEKIIEGAKRSAARISATPVLHPRTNAVAGYLKDLREFGNKYEVKPWVPLLGGASVGDMWLGQSPEEVENWSYGNAPIRINPYAGRTASYLPEVKPGRQGPLADTLMLAADVLPAAAGITKVAKPLARAAKPIIKEMALNAPRVLDEMGQRYGLPSTTMSIMKPKGGQWLPGDVEYQLQYLTLRNLANNGVLLSPSSFAINDWVDKTLTRYIKNEMATAEDPVRLALDAFPEKKAQMLAAKQKQLDKAVADMEAAQADRGIAPEMLTHSQERIRDLQKELAQIDARTGLHYDPLWPINVNKLALDRSKAGFPAGGIGESDLARRYEDVADSIVYKQNARDWLGIYKDEYIDSAMPWLRKIPPETPVHSLSGNNTVTPVVTEHPGGEHLVDELRNAVTPQSGLPKDLLIDPEDLSKLTMAQVVEHVDKINAWRAVKKVEADAALANNPATHLFKEYPEGFRWVELKVPAKGNLVAGKWDEPAFDVPDDIQTHYMDQAAREAEAAGLDEDINPDEFQGYMIGRYRELAEEWSALNPPKVNKDLQDAIKYEGDLMRNCVGAYCNKVMLGESRIFSLRDAKNEPHVTIELKPDKDPLEVAYDRLDKKVRNELRTAAEAKDPAGIPWRPTWPDDEADNHRKLIRETMLERFPELADLKPKMSIEQIKGKRNEAPNPEHLPFVQDFVKGGDWSEVKELSNAGLYKAGTDEAYARAGQRLDVHPADLRNFHLTRPEGSSPYYTEKELREFLNLNQEPPTGMAGGGVIKATRSGIKDLMELVAKYRGKYGAQRVERAADEVPNLEQQYTKHALERAFTQSNPQGLMIMQPKLFEEYAKPLPPRLLGRTEEYNGFHVPKGMTYEQYIDYLAQTARDSGFDDVPQLYLDAVGDKGLRISGHEGRHRTRALEQLGDKSTLVRVFPREKFTSAKAREDKEDYINALRESLGSYPLVNPEIFPHVKLPLPEIFADGGPVHMDEGGVMLGDKVKARLYGNYTKNKDDSFYEAGVDVDMLSKYGLGLTASGSIVKIPKRTYTWDDGYSETVPGMKIKSGNIDELRARYITDDGIVYGVGHRPIEKGWTVQRDNPRDESSFGITVSPIYRGISYRKNFERGGPVMKVARAIKDSQSDEFKEHMKWYNSAMPSMLREKYAVELGNYRVNGSPLDTAEEFAGAVDYGQRVKDYARALDNAKIHHALTFRGKAARDAVKQDAAGLAFGMCNPLLSKDKVVDAAAQYAKEHDYGLGPQFQEEYAKGGQVHAEFNFGEVSSLADQLTDFNYDEISNMADQLVESTHG